MVENILHNIHQILLQLSNLTPKLTKMEAGDYFGDENTLSLAFFKWVFDVATNLISLSELF